MEIFLLCCGAGAERGGELYSACCLALEELHVRGHEKE